MKNIVIIGGGTGTSTLLKGFKKYPVNLCVIVSTADDGGSSGVLRRQLGVLPPGDIRQCLTALANNQSLAEIFAFRLNRGINHGHVIGNLILAHLEKEFKSPEKAIEFARELLSASGNVMPVTLKPTVLSATYENGKTVVGEHNIDQPKQDLRFKIQDLSLSPKLKPNPKVLWAIKHADIIVFGPGDLYTSVLPNVLVKGLKEAVNSSGGKKVLVTNIMTKHGQTDGFRASDFVRELEKYLGSKINIVIANNKQPSLAVLKKYAREQAKFVEADLQNSPGLKVIATNLLAEELATKHKADKLKRSFLRHNSTAIAKLIWKLL